MVSLSLIDDFAQHFDFIYANTDDLKHQCYLIRVDAHGQRQTNDSALRSRLDIDQYDAHSLHALLRHRASGKFVATIRVIGNQDKQKPSLLPFERSTRDTIFVDKQPLHELPRTSFSQISGMAIRPEFATYSPITEMTTALFLSAVALARLEFHHYTFARLECNLFKSLRAQGLSFEHACLLNQEGQREAIYYLNVEAGIAQSSAIYHLSQHILNEFAHQLHMPLVLDSDEDAVQSA